MNKHLKTLTLGILTILAVGVVSCSNNTDDMTNETPQTQTDTMSATDYEKYAVDRYNYYFHNDQLGMQYDMYNIYSDNFDYTGTYDEFVTGYNDFYTKDKANLEAYKKDLESNYKAGDPEVDKVYNDIMGSVNNSLTAMNDYSESFVEKTKDYATLAKDEVKQGLRDLGEVPHNARVELDKMIQSAKDRLNMN